MPEPLQIVIAFAIPGVLSLILALVAWRPWSSAKPRGQWAMPVALGVGMAMAVVGFAYKFKLPGWPPILAEDWLFWGGLAVALVGLVNAFVPLPNVVRWLLTAAVAGALCYLVLGNVARQWPTSRAMLVIGGVAIAIAAAAAFIEKTSDNNPGWLVPLILTICAGALAPWPLFHSVPDFTFRAASIPINLLPMLVIAVWATHFTLARGGAMAFAVLYGAILVMGEWRINDVPTWQVLMLAAAPLVALLPLWLPIRGWMKAMIGIVLAVAMVLTVVVPSYQEWQRQQASPEAFWGA